MSLNQFRRVWPGTTVFIHQQDYVCHSINCENQTSQRSYLPTTSTEEKIHIIIKQTGESIKSKAIDSQRDRSREGQIFIESDSVGVVVIRYGSMERRTRATDIKPSLSMPFYTIKSVECVSLL
jgi:hypothetical protein